MWVVQSWEIFRQGCSGMDSPAFNKSRLESSDEEDATGDEATVPPSESRPALRRRLPRWDPRKPAAPVMTARGFEVI